ncbi:hypothetical protein ACS0TY_009443 [Phlomoides rotata]
MSMESETGQEKPSMLSSMLGPGFRFHPTDEELVQYYLRRKISGKGFRFDAISDVDVYKSEPWDLPRMSKLKTRDLEWYFFSFLDKKYGNGSRTNRATEKGYWKTTGKDRTVYHRRQVVGMKKTLVFHNGRPPKGLRTNWVMHEYRRAGLEVEIAGITQKDAFVLCRIFQKSGSGPKNGEQYGAPLVEEEWDSDELELVQSDGTEEGSFGEDTCLNSSDVQQVVASDVPSNTVPLPLTFQYADASHVEETTASFSGPEKPLVSAGVQRCETNMCDDKNITNMAAASYDMGADAVPVMLENTGECRSGNSDDFDFFLDEAFLDSLDNNLPNSDEGFIEASDISTPSENTASFDMLDEYLMYFDANDDSSLYLASDPAMMFGNENLFSGQTLIPQKEMGEASEQAVLPSGQLIDNLINDDVSYSDKHELAKYQSDRQYLFIKRASQMLGSIPAPPAFAAESPSKDAILRLNSILQSASPLHVSASTVHVRSGTDRSSGKHENFNVVLSFGISRGDDGSSSLESSVSIVPGKTASSMSGWLYFIFLWVLILSMGFRFGTYICAN